MNLEERESAEAAIHVVNFRPLPALAEVLLTAAAQNGNHRLFTVVCCVGIPPLAEAPGDI